MKSANIIPFFSVILATITGCSNSGSEQPKQQGCKDSVYILTELHTREQYMCEPDQDISIPAPSRVMCTCRKESAKTTTTAEPQQAPPTDSSAPSDAEVTP